MTPTQAGWTDTLAPVGPVDCPGSGQVAIFAPVGAAVPCPVCERMVRIAQQNPDELPCIVDHRAPEPVAPSLSLGL